MLFTFNLLNGQGAGIANKGLMQDADRYKQCQPLPQMIISVFVYSLQIGLQVGTLFFKISYLTNLVWKKKV